MVAGLLLQNRMGFLSPVGNPLLSDAVLVEPFDNLNNWTTVGTTIVPGGRTGNCANMTGTLGACNYYLPAAAESDTMILGFAWQTPALSTGAHTIVVFRSDSGTIQHNYIRTDNTGALGVYSGPGVLYPGGSYAAGIVPGTWYYLEYRSKLHDTLGTAELWLNGVKVINLSALDTKNGGVKTTYDNVYLIRPSGSTSLTNLYDDLYIKTGPTAVVTGPIKV